MSMLSKMKSRGSGGTSMRNDSAATQKSQHPTNKDPENVTPGPQYLPPEKSNAIKMKIPDSLAKGSTSGEAVHHLASGHHVKNSDGSTSFHMHALDGEPVSADNMEPSEGQGAGDEGATASNMSGDPYGVATALKGMNA